MRYTCHLFNWGVGRTVLPQQQVRGRPADRRDPRLQPAGRRLRRRPLQKRPHLGRTVLGRHLLRRSHPLAAARPARNSSARSQHGGGDSPPPEARAPLPHLHVQMRQGAQLQQGAQPRQGAQLMRRCGRPLAHLNPARSAAFGGDGEPGARGIGASCRGRLAASSTLRAPPGNPTSGYRSTHRTHPGWQPLIWGRVGQHAAIETPAGAAQPPGVRAHRFVHRAW